MPKPFARLAAAVLVGAALAATITVSTSDAAAVAPRMDRSMQPLNVGQDQHSAFPGMTREPSGMLRLVWRQGSDHKTSRDGRIMTAESYDDGATWSNVQTLRVNPDYRDPSISSIDGIEYMTWFGARSDSEPALGAGVMRYMQASGGRIDPPSNPQGAISAPLVKLPDGRLGAAFYGKKPGENIWTAWMGWSSDSAWSWSSNRIVNFIGAGVNTPEPYLVVNGTSTHMLFRWGDSAIGIRSSPDSGATWDQPRQILANATGRPTVIATAGYLVVVYREASTGSAVMAYSVDNGASWQPGEKVLTAPAGGMMTYAAMVPGKDNPKTIRLVVGMEQAGGVTSQLWGGTVTLP